MYDKETFIEKAKKRHGDKYIYSKVEYIDSKTKVCIICPEHGEFWQTPSSHLRGQCCPLCANKKRGRNIHSEEWIELANEIHKGKYDYSKAKIENSNKPVCIICPEHGEFWMTINNHVNQKQGCPKCAGQNFSLGEIIEKFRLVHGDRYDYSKCERKKMNDKWRIICPEHGEFLQSATKHLKGQGCPICGGRKKKNTDDFVIEAKTVHGDKYNYSKVEYVNNNTPVIIICPKHGDFKQTPLNHLHGHGCPKCTKELLKKKKENKNHPIEGKKIKKENIKTDNKQKKPKKLTQDEVIERFKKTHGDRYDYSKFEYVNMNTKSVIICPEHGEFMQTPANHIKGNGCPKCAGFNLTRDEVIEKFRKIHGGKYDYSETFFEKLGDKTTIICPKHGKFKTSPSKHIEGRGCPKCAIEKTAEINRVTEDEFKERGNAIHKNKYLYDRLGLTLMQGYVEIGCPVHGYFRQMANEHLRGRGCPICGMHVSHAEEEIVEYIKSLIGEKNVISRDRSVLDGRELDIYIPSYDLAIEYNGNYWHSESKGRDSKYHINKLNECNNKGVSLVQIFEDEWIFHKDIVLSKIRHMLKKDEKLEKVYGRKCMVKEIGKSEAKEFLSVNHIQGYGSSSVLLGCFYNNTLVGVMTFRNDGNGCWELDRFATDINKTCVGVGGKLFKYFTENYNPIGVKSFADRRWTVSKNDNLYTKLGFVLEDILPPDYRYVKPDSVERIHKFNMRKNTLHEKYGLPLSMTEREMTEKLKFSRIWDCGLLKYVWRRK